MLEDKISIEVTRDEALVLFEFAQRFTNEETLTLAHPAEEAALWGLGAALERTLVEPLEPEYEALLAQARESLATRTGVGSSGA